MSTERTLVDDTSRTRLTALEDSLSQMLLGKRDVIRLVITALLAKGHVLLEDVPGVGKTTLARALSLALGLRFSRIQCTADLLPSDILGLSVLRPDSRELEFRPGPIFSQLVLADEINRSSPRTQSSLLEAMNEGSVSLEGKTMPLSQPFFVIATQNPHEFQGTYPLPESQLDRFLLRLQLGYPSEDAERQLLSGVEEQPSTRLVLSAEQLLSLQEKAAAVRVDTSLVDYVLRILQLTRQSPQLSLGVSPRGGRALIRAAKAHAFLEGRLYCLPDDIKKLAVHVFAHRVFSSLHGGHLENRRDYCERVIRELVSQVPVPV